MWQSIRIQLIVTNNKNDKLGKSKHWQWIQQFIERWKSKFADLTAENRRRKSCFGSWIFLSKNSISSKHLIFLAKIHPISLELEHSYPIKPSRDWAAALSFSLQIDTLIFLMPDRTASWEIKPNFHSIPSKTPFLRSFVNVICARPNTRYKLFGSWLFGYASRG